VPQASFLRLGSQKSPALRSVLWTDLWEGHHRTPRPNLDHQYRKGQRVLLPGACPFFPSINRDRDALDFPPIFMYEDGNGLVLARRNE